MVLEGIFVGKIWVSGHMYVFDIYINAHSHTYIYIYTCMHACMHTLSVRRSVDLSAQIRRSERTRAIVN